MDDSCIYLDYMATTPVDSRVIKAMQTCLGLDGCFGNPASNTHIFGVQAAEKIAAARAQVAALLQVTPKEIIWTSGATESNNLAIKGACDFYHRRGKHIVTMKTEHKAVLDTCAYLETQGYEVTALPAESSGRLNLDLLRDTLRDDTVLVSVMAVNNETGVIQDLQTVGEIVKDKGALFHVDAAQALGKIPLNLSALPVDLMSFSGHKVYGPKGIGALYVRREPRLRLTPQIHGGGHEYGLRSGTLPTHQIVGMGQACEIAAAEMPEESLRIQSLRALCWEQLRNNTNAVLHGDPVHHIPGCLNVAFPGFSSRELLLRLPELALSTGSACNSATPKPSHVLLGMGVDPVVADCALRISFGRFTTEQAVQKATALLVNHVRSVYKSA